VPQLDLHQIYAPYEDQLRGAPPFDPRLMTCLWLYAYSVGVFLQPQDRYPPANATWPFWPLSARIAPTSVPSVTSASSTSTPSPTCLPRSCGWRTRAGLVQLGAWATDGSKFPGNASRHKAMSYGYMQKEEERLKAEITDLLKTGPTDGRGRGRCPWDPAVAMNCPRNCAFRRQRLARIQEAKQRLQQTGPGGSRGGAAAGARRRRSRSGRARDNPGGRPAGPLHEEPDAKAQTNFTDPELKIMQQNNKGWDYGGKRPGGGR